MPLDLGRIDPGKRAKLHERARLNTYRPPMVFTVKSEVVGLAGRSARD
jgi:hypothetical protein